MNKEILEKLLPETDEELKILNGKNTIDRNIYMNNSENVINAKKLLDSGKLITIRPHTRFIDFPEHTHDYVEVVYMCKGQTRHIINGREIILKEGELLFLSQNAKQSIKKAGKYDIAVNFIVLPQFFDKALSMIGEEETPLRKFLIDCLRNKEDSSGYLHFCCSDVFPVQNLIDNLLWTLIHDTPNKRMINQTTMGLLFMHLCNFSEKVISGSSDANAILQVFRYIEDHYQNGSLAEIADILHYDFYWLSREIKQQTGQTYTQLLQQKRLSQAAYLLKSTNMKIADIAAAVGYDNASYFYRLFEKNHKMTPKRYRTCK
jgi:AraC family L-rhamnose operon regulatory protein RhaS